MTGKGGRHAYLILCHGNFNQLVRLIGLIDDCRNDIYIHIDKKCRNAPLELLRGSAKKSRIYFTERVKVNWGGFSMVEAELLLLKSAAAVGYEYYHLISGADLPLMNQDKIHAFFDKHAGEEFVTLDPVANKEHNFYDRIMYYHLFQNAAGKSKGLLMAFLRRAERTLIWIQEKLRTDRLGEKKSMFFKGAQWFSVTDRFARYLIENESFARKYYKWTTCSDEIFVQTAIMNSPFKDDISKIHTRFTDWKRGNPYTFKTEDFELLTSCNRIFARKFDENTDSNIIDLICGYVKKDCPK